MTVPHFQRELRRFRDEIYPRHSEDPFTSFRDGAARAWEGYKPRLRAEALDRLKANSWKEAEVGTGLILEHTINAIEIGGNEQQRNNLVPWDGRYGPSTVAHAVFLAARARPDARSRIERWLFDAFASEHEPAELFERFRGIAGDGYALPAYFFFLIDDERFAPIAPRTFDEAFRRLGITLTTSGQCSWPNYRAYNDALEDVRRELQTAGYDGARHIDAHSFCWMLIRMEDDAPGDGRPGAVRYASARRRSIVTMAEHAAAAAAQSGATVTSIRKDKQIHHARQELERIIETLIERQAGLCAITGLPLGWLGECEDPAMLVSLDRIDSDGHYKEDNLQVVCRFVNMWKRNSPDGEFRRLLALLRACLFEFGADPGKKEERQKRRKVADMKPLSTTDRRRRKAGSPGADRQADSHVILGTIPGLARLLPGRYRPGQPVRSRYGTWILPIAYKGRRVTAVVNGTMLG
jgi:hypothetical protein